MEIQRVIVTGSTGIVRVNFLKYLSKKGISAVALVWPGSSRINTIQNIELVKVVACELSALSEFESNESLDVFYHLGWEYTGKEFRNDSYRQNKNIAYTLDAVKLAAKLGCKTFIGTGSQAEYGRVADKISPDTPTFPDNAYGAAKLCAYKTSQIYANSLGINHIWARIFSIYGPFDSADTLISKTISLLLHHDTPAITKGEQQWDYLYAEDLAKALFLLGEKGVNNSVYCLGSGQTRTIREYIEVVKSIIDPSANIDFGKIPYSNNQVMHLCADIEKLTNDTGFLPEYSFEEGIKKTIEWQRQSLSQ